MITLNNFEEKYILLRKRENRLYTDEQVRLLPDIDKSHVHYGEWRVRKTSSNKLVQYLSTKKTELNILEVGCGNGWLCSHLSKIKNSQVTGIDINKTELEQARRVFNNINNLHFICSEMTDENIRKQKFDVIIFAASIQYFPSIDVILQPALKLLNPHGEIHILDSHFYSSSQMVAARRRSANYYQSIELEGMSKYYFHRCFDELKPYNFKILFRPGTVFSRFTKNKNPFCWICIYRHA